VLVDDLEEWGLDAGKSRQRGASRHFDILASKERVRTHFIVETSRALENHAMKNILAP